MKSNEKISSIKLIDMAIESSEKSKNEKDRNIIFCDKFLNELRKITGEDLAPHLESAVYKKEIEKVVVTLTF